MSSTLMPLNVLAKANSKKNANKEDRGCSSTGGGLFDDLIALLLDLISLYLPHFLRREGRLATSHQAAAFL